jgi:hypothetical protein
LDAVTDPAEIAKSLHRKTADKLSRMPPQGGFYDDISASSPLRRFGLVEFLGGSMWRLTDLGVVVWALLQQAPAPKA